MTSAPARNRPSGVRRAQARAGYLFILPAAVLYAAFVLAPVILTAILAFAYYDPMMGSYWVGWDNFHRFFTDHRSLQILWNTLRFALFAVSFNVAVGLALALALSRAMPGWLLYFFRLAFFLPVIIAAAFVSIGLILALALNRAMPGWLLYFFRLAFFLPVIIAAAFVSMLFIYFFVD